MDLKVYLSFIAAVLLTIVAKRVECKEPLNGQSSPRHDEEFYKTLLEIADCCRVFNNFTLTDMQNYVDEITTWQPPMEIQQKFPFYQAGYDAENRPVWVVEIGKYNFKEQVVKGSDVTSNLEKYFSQATLLYLEVGHSLVNSNERVKNITLAVAIIDMDKFELAQLTHPQTLSFLLKTFKTYSHFLNAGVQKVFIINVDFNPDVITKYGTAIFGQLVSKFEVYGKRGKWEPVLKKAIPDSSLPTWYGGSQNYKPVKVYG